MPGSVDSLHESTAEPSHNLNIAKLTWSGAVNCYVMRFHIQQFSNPFNINKGLPIMDITRGSFGRITHSQLTSQAGPRTVQMTLRLQF